MQRDMDLIRKLVFAVEEIETYRDTSDFVIEGQSQEAIAYHLVLMAEANLITATKVTMDHRGPPELRVERLTWAGHDFADVARSDTIWAKVTAGVKSRAGSVSLDVLNSLLKKAAAYTVEHGPGWINSAAGWFQ